MEREEARQKVLAQKQQISDLQQMLAIQHRENLQQQERKERETELRMKSKNKTAKFSSFEGAINRKPFIQATHAKEKFTDEMIFIDNTLPAMTATQKLTLIAPDRNCNPEHFTYRVDRPLIKLKSDIPPLKPEQMSEKEMKRLNKWASIMQQNEVLDIQEKTRLLVGTTKKAFVESREQKVFKPANISLRIFDPRLSLINENPITPRTLKKMIDLPRLYEKKVWIPNDNYF